MFVIHTSTKAIEFDKSKEAFELLYEGWVVGSAVQPPNERTWETMILELSVTKEFHRVGIPAPCGRKLATWDIAMLYPDNENHELIIDNIHLDLIKKYFKAVPSWNITKFETVLMVWEKLND